MELHHTHFPFENKNSRHHIQKKTPADFSPQGSVSLQFEGVNTFLRGGIFFRREPEKPGDIGRSDIKKTPHSFTTTW